MKNQVNTKAYTQKAIYIKQCKRSFFWLYVKLQTTKTYLLPLYTKPSISYKINQKLYLVFIITLTTSIVQKRKKHSTPTIDNVLVWKLEISFSSKNQTSILRAIYYLLQHRSIYSQKINNISVPPSFFLFSAFINQFYIMLQVLS